MENPFKYGGIVRGSYFAERNEELLELAREMDNLSRVFLISPRRLGKTCLLYNLIDHLGEKGIATVYLDIYAFPDIKSLAVSFTQLSANALESNKDKLIKIFSSFQRLRPKVTVGADGSLGAGVEVVVTEKEALSALLEGMNQAEQLAKNNKKKLVVIIDEFSDINKYNGNSLEKALRSEIQRHENIGYIFSGSEQSMMLSMVRDKKRAFYKLGRIMELGPIKHESYTKFINNWFNKNGYTIEEEFLDKIFELGDNIPYNIQRLCYNLWEKMREEQPITLKLIEELPILIGRQDTPHYELLWQSVSQIQRNLMIALCKTPQLKPFSKEFQLTHGIGPSSSIKASLDSLCKKAILVKKPDASYQFADIFMQYWIMDKVPI